MNTEFNVDCQRYRILAVIQHSKKKPFTDFNTKCKKKNSHNYSSSLSPTEENLCILQAIPLFAKPSLVPLVPLNQAVSNAGRPKC